MRVWGGKEFLFWPGMRISRFIFQFVLFLKSFRGKIPCCTLLGTLSGLCHISRLRSTTLSLADYLSAETIMLFLWCSLSFLWVLAFVREISLSHKKISDAFSPSTAYFLIFSTCEINYGSTLCYPLHCIAEAEVLSAPPKLVYSKLILRWAP